MTTSKIQSVKDFRDTFGIISQSTKLKYEDIISFTLTRDTFFYFDLNSKVYIHERADKMYILHMDSTLKRALREYQGGKGVEVIISLQERTNGFFAIARIDRKLDKKSGGEENE